MAQSAGPPASSASSELARRVVSGVVMATVALALTYAGGWWFTALVAVAAVVMCWEWDRLTRTAPGLPPRPFDLSHGPLAAHAACAVCVVALTAFGHPVWALALIAVTGIALIASGRDTPLAALGIAYVGIPVLGLVWLRLQPAFGLAAVLFLFLAVWVTDIGAYAVGRTVGGPKLAPRISPGKTWSGLIGGVTLSGLTGAAFAAYVGEASSVRLGLVAVVLGVAAQIGDLFESALKRRSGLKDSSTIIPGHGGLLDRVDGLVAAVALVTLIAVSQYSDAPARGLILGR